MISLLFLLVGLIVTLYIFVLGIVWIVELTKAIFVGGVAKVLREGAFGMSVLAVFLVLLWAVAETYHY